MSTVFNKNSRKQIVVHFYDTRAACELLDGLRIATQAGLDLTPPNADSEVVNPDSTQTVAVISDRMNCASCDFSFADRNQQKGHYKSDWHRFNLKQRLKEKNSMTEDQFELISGDVSSISGSDSEAESTDSEDESSLSLITPSVSSGILSRNIRHPEDRQDRTFFINAKDELISIYKCVIQSKNVPPDADIVHSAQSLPHSPHCAVVMCAGGHFAAAIFDSNEVVCHKTFHRYVVRAKRGTAQSVRDAHGNAPKSGGATLRRYNEAALTQEIQTLLESWSKPLADCSAIYIRAPSVNKAIFFGGRKPPLEKNDARIRTIPFVTRRPTFSEVKRVHCRLSVIECHGPVIATALVTIPPPDEAELTPVMPDIEKIDLSNKDPTPTGSECAKDTKSGWKNTTSHLSKKAKTRNKIMDENEGSNSKDVSDPEKTRLTNQLYTACRTADLDLLQRSLADLESIGQSEGSKSADDVAPVKTVINEPFGRGRTLLHLAASEGHPEVVSMLLKVGADPGMRDASGMTAYQLATTKATRNAFRQFVRANPQAFQYTDTQIPAPLSEERETEKRKKEAERRRGQRKVRKEKEKVLKAEQETMRQEEKERQRYLDLSDREKRALAAEKRLVTQFKDQNIDHTPLSRCWKCATDLTGKVPFEYYHYRFCSPACLKSHRQAAAPAKR